MVAVYINVTCAAAVTQPALQQQLLETATVGTYANVTLVARGADGRRIPAGLVTFRLEDPLFYVTEDGKYL